MRLTLNLLTLLAALSPFALADVQFTSPAAGATIPAGALTITWKDSGVAPAISTLQSYQLFLMVGGNDDSTMLQLTALVPTGQFSTGNSATGTVDAGVAGPTKNGFFLKMISVAAEGGQVINYSDRFTLTGMTGTTAATYADAVPAGTKGPPTDNGVSNGDTTTGVPAAGDTGVPYNLQSGLTKYAPMQPIPPTKITKKQFSPLFPTSAYTIATAFLPNPSILTTVTASQTFSASSMENTVRIDIVSECGRGKVRAIY